MRALHARTEAGRIDVLTGTDSFAVVVEAIGPRRLFSEDCIKELAPE
jgi:hypothetical protein